MNEVADTGPVGGVEVVSEYVETFETSACDASYLTTPDD